MKYYAVTTFFVPTAHRAHIAASITNDVVICSNLAEDVIRRPRTVGVFGDWSAAEDCVLMNMGDIHEAGYYSHVAIEEQEFGLYPIPSAQWIYEWDEKKGGYVLLFKTTDYKGLFSRIG